VSLSPASSRGSSGGSSELDYEEITANLNITGTTSGTATSVFPGTSVAYSATPVLISFFSIQVNKGTSNINLGVAVDGTFVRLIYFSLANSAVPVFFTTRYTPTAGAHTITIKAFVDAGTGVVLAGNGTGGNNAQAYMRISSA
jgi:hypothetical protein